MYQVEQKIAEEAQEMRAVFAEVMEEFVQQDERVVYLDADIINSIGMTNFWKKHPDRTVNCGIQEANMIGTAAGMSATGLIPFAHTFGTFATRRVMDQVFISAAYAKLNLRIIGSDPRYHGIYQRRHAYAARGHGHDALHPGCDRTGTGGFGHAG